MLKKKVLAICGSTRTRSANLSIIRYVAALMPDKVEMDIYEGLSDLPHFNPDLDKDIVPPTVQSLRDRISEADGVLICTPEYVFSLPGALKNALEWCVSTILFSEKPVALITASASGVKAHESLQLVLKTIGASLREETQLLIQGAKGKVDGQDTITDPDTGRQLKELAAAFAVRLQTGT
jgi:chromate reductase, NAD(P)H dehydrogenase (quinone)